MKVLPSAPYLNLDNYLYIILDCGKTIPMTKIFDVSNDNEGKMHCSPDKPCRCHGNICLVSNNKEECDRGNVFIKGTPLCGIRMSEELGKIICQELGFQNLVSTTSKGE